MVAVKFYDSFYKNLGDNDIDLVADTFKIMLVTSSYTFSFAHDKRDDITNEITGTGYTAGGATLGSKTLTTDGTNHWAAWDFDDPSWASSTLTARGAAIYKSRGGAASADELVAFIDFERDESSSNVEFKIQINATGFAVIRAG